MESLPEGSRTPRLCRGPHAAQTQTLCSAHVPTDTLLPKGDRFLPTWVHEPDMLVRAQHASHLANNNSYLPSIYSMPVTGLRSWPVSPLPHNFCQPHFTDKGTEVQQGEATEVPGGWHRQVWHPALSECWGTRSSHRPQLNAYHCPPLPWLPPRQ